MHIWQWLIAHMKNAIDSPVKLDIREALSTLLFKFKVLVLSHNLSSSLIMVSKNCQIKKNVKYMVCGEGLFSEKCMTSRYT